MSEVAQLNDMHAVLIASKEDNDRKSQEVEQMRGKICELEKRLEEGVTFTDKYREAKAAATRALRQRVEKLDDLLLKVDHVAGKVFDASSSTVRDVSEGVSKYLEMDKIVKAEHSKIIARMEELSQRDSQCRKEEAKGVAQANQSLEERRRELANRCAELDIQLREQDNDGELTEATTVKVLQEIQERHLEQDTLKQKMQKADLELQETSKQLEDTLEEMCRVTASSKGDTAVLMSKKEAVAAEMSVLKAQLEEVSDVVLTKASKNLEMLEVEESQLKEEGGHINKSMEEAVRESKEENRKVLELNRQLEEKEKTREELAGQLVATQNIIAGHSVNQPEFAFRKQEHEHLTASISKLKSRGGTLATRKAEVEEDMRVNKEKSSRIIQDLNEETRALEKERETLQAERQEIGSARTPLQETVAEIREQIKTLETKRSFIHPKVYH
ncbi:unnamed protein product [Discosporangium mesarthrocarpum]